MFTLCSLEKNGTHVSTLSRCSFFRALWYYYGNQLLLFLGKYGYHSLAFAFLNFFAHSVMAKF
jgi:polyhydroxyalkanoate synthesis regulator protein